MPCAGAPPVETLPRRGPAARGIDPVSSERMVTMEPVPDAVIAEILDKIILQLVIRKHCESRTMPIVSASPTGQRFFGLVGPAF